MRERGGHFARCTHMLQGGDGRPWRRTGAEPCMWSPPIPFPDRRKEPKTIQQQKPQSWLDVGFASQGQEGQRLCFGLFMANTLLGLSSFLRTYHTHWSCVMHPKIWVLGRLPGNLRPGQGLEVGTSLEVTLERQL